MKTRTKIEEFVGPPNISETVAVRPMKLAHRPRIAWKMIKLISKPIVLSILLIIIILKTIQPIGAGTPNITKINLQGAEHWCCHLADQFELYYFLYLSV